MLLHKKVKGAVAYNYKKSLCNNSMFYG